MRSAVVARETDEAADRCYLIIRGSVLEFRRRAEQAVDEDRRIFGLLSKMDDLPQHVTSRHAKLLTLEHLLFSLPDLSSEIPLTVTHLLGSSCA